MRKQAKCGPNKVKRLLGIRSLCLTAFCLYGSLSPNAASATQPDRIDRLIVKYKQPSDQNVMMSMERASLQQGKTVTLRRSRHITATQANIYYFDRPQSGAEAHRIAQELQQDPAVEYAEPDYRRYPTGAFIPNDDEYFRQWYLRQSSVTPGAINAELAWEVTRGSSSIVIAVIDTGILQHQDIPSGRVLPGYDFISDPFRANDGDGRDPDPTDPGNFITAAESDAAGCAESNSSWHGTRVTGLLIAQTDNNQGIAGLDHNASVLPLRTLGKCGGLVSDIADAIYWAAGLPVPGAPDNDNPAHVINLSLGSDDPCSETEQLAINAAVSAGVVIVAAAGNDGANVDSPASCNNVIAVAATTQQGGRTCYTNFGPKVDLGAPGGNRDISICFGSGSGIRLADNNGTTTVGTDNYNWAYGTSFSTPLVAGTAALMKAVDSTLTPASIEEYLKHTARNFPTGTADSASDCNTSLCGSGILDAFGAVTAAGNGGLDSVPNPFGLPNKTDVELNTSFVLDGITVSGIDTETQIHIDSNGEYSINNRGFTDRPGTVTTGQKVRVKLKSAGQFDTQTSTSLTIGGISETFSITTKTSDGSGNGGGGSCWLLPLCLALLLRKRISLICTVLSC